jgi:hypothetical protein
VCASSNAAVAVQWSNAPEKSGVLVSGPGALEGHKLAVAVLPTVSLGAFPISRASVAHHLVNLGNLRVEVAAGTRWRRWPIARSGPSSLTRGRRGLMRSSERAIEHFRLCLRLQHRSAVVRLHHLALA